jgi:hypothetical protein
MRRGGGSVAGTEGSRLVVLEGLEGGDEGKGDGEGERERENLEVVVAIISDKEGRCR